MKKFNALYAIYGFILGGVFGFCVWLVGYLVNYDPAGAIDKFDGPTIYFATIAIVIGSIAGLLTSFVVAIVKHKR